MKTDHEMGAVKARAMSKSELALMYLPHLTPHSAVNRLMSWVKYNPQLMCDLEDASYRSRQQMLTARQVAIVFQHLGEP